MCATTNNSRFQPEVELEEPAVSQPEIISVFPKPQNKFWGKFSVPTVDYFIHYVDVKRKPIGDYIEKPLAEIRQGSLVYDVELIPGQGARLARSPGTSIRVLDKKDTHAVLQLPSKAKREVDLNCVARLGKAPSRFFPHKKLSKIKQRRYIYHRDHMLKNKPRRLYEKHIFNEKYRREMAPTMPPHKDDYDYKRFGQKR